MSLFGNPNYRYRDTYFVLFERAHRPTVSQMTRMIDDFGAKYTVAELRQSDDRVDSLTLFAPQDFSAMDLAYVEGDDVVNQVNEIREEFRALTVRGDDVEKLKQLKHFDARFDIFHFEQEVEAVEEDELFDPGALLLLMEKLAELCRGIGYDPQSQSLM